MLDAREYLHLAVRSSQDGEHEKALEQLHACLEQEPGNGMALFMLGAEYTELGIYDRAIESMEKSIAADSENEMAYLQLGMLHASLDQLDKAVSYWEQLLNVVKLEYLRMMTNGLILICKDQRQEGMKLVAEGMELNNENAALNQSMRNIMQALSADQQEAVPEETGKPYLGAYRNSAIGED